MATQRATPGKTKLTFYVQISQWASLTTATRILRFFCFFTLIRAIGASKLK